MALNIATFEQTLVKKISSATSDYDLLLLSKALTLLKNGSVNVVTQFTDLPVPSSNGQMYFVECDNEVYFSSDCRWTSLVSTVKSRLYGWGTTISGEELFGNGTELRGSTEFVEPLGCIGDWKKTSMNNHVLAITEGGQLWTWGRNNSGQLGTNNLICRSSPVTVAGGGTTWCDASAGLNFSTAVKTDGTLWTWGQGNCGQLGNGSSGLFTVRSSPGITAGGGTNWSKVEASCQHSIALKTDGTLWTWGDNTSGTLGDGSIIKRSSPVTVAGGGTTWCAIGIGWRSGIAIKTDGTLWTWGENISGRLGDETTTHRSSPVTVAGGGTTWCFAARTTSASNGGHTSLAIKTDGTLWTWGQNYGTIGDGTTIGTSRSSPGTTAGGGTTWCFGSLGFKQVGALKTDGTLWAWGISDQNDSLGINSIEARSSPTSGRGSNWSRIDRNPVTCFSFGIQKTNL